LIWNPGNALIRNLIEKLCKKQDEAESNKLVKLKRREMVLDIIEEVSKTSRFLVWNEGGWWNEMFDREQLILKIVYLVKEVRKSKRERQQLKLDSSTSMFRGQDDGAKRRARPYEHNNTNDSSDDDKSVLCGKRFFKFP